MKRKFIVKQQDIKDCGICCLESIIKYYKGYIPLEILRLDTKTNSNGTTAYNLLKTAKKYGLKGTGKKIDDINSKDIILPCIAHTITNKGINHFVVIYKITNKYIYIMDPSKGYIKKEIDIFLKEWTNVILILKPYKTIPLYKIKNNIKDLIVNVIHYSNSYIKQILLTNIIIIILSIITSYHYQITLSSNNIILVSFIFLFLNIFKLYINHIRNNITINLSTSIDLSIIPKFISHIIDLPLNVIKSRTPGEIITRVQDLNSIKQLFSEVLINIILDTSLIVCSSIFLYTINNRLFLILCIISLLYILVGLVSSPILNRKINNNIDNETEFNSALGETISSLETIKNLNLTNNHTNKLVSKYSTYIHSIFNFNSFYNVINTIYSSINDIGLLIISSYGIYLNHLDKLSLVSLITFNSLVSYFLEPIKDIIRIIPTISEIKLSYTKVQEFLSIEPEQLRSKENFIPGNIKFSNISYSYDDYHNVINNLSISLKENNHYIVRGHTGSGKSTLFKMLNHNINDYKGKITIGDINIKDYSLNTLRSNILYVSQQDKLFTDTIYNNIVLDKYISKSKLNYILKITKVDELISKKSLRLDSYLYDDGFNLSGGEKQRIILARALVQNPKILILDESLSEVDKSTENYILRNLGRHLSKTTIIYITHTNSKVFKNIINITNSYQNN
jgi:ATP-binding cassette subfamily B protein